MHAGTATLAAPDASALTCRFAADERAGHPSPTRGIRRAVAVGSGLVSLTSLAALAVHAGGLLPLSALDPGAPGGQLCLVASAALLAVAMAIVRTDSLDPI